MSVGELLVARAREYEARCASCSERAELVVLDEGASGARSAADGLASAAVGFASVAIALREVAEVLREVEA